MTGDHGTVGRGLVQLLPVVAVVCATFAGALVLASENSHARGERASPIDGFAVRPGYSLEIDATGFELPTAIAFVPEPGKGPDAVLYYVTELQGRVKAVTNDHRTHVFSTVATPDLPNRQLKGEAQSGLAGLCLDPERGYVFVTFAYRDAKGYLRNNVVRFTSMPRTFGTRPTAVEDFREIFSSARSSPSHQIGACQVDGDRFFAGIGDGGNAGAAGNLNVLLGKIVCMTVDGNPCSDGPFAERGSGRGPAAYVWAYGFRNPFGMRMLDGDLIVAENGLNLDRLVRVRRGQDHHWDGTDLGIGVDAEVVFAPPPPAPVHIDYVTSRGGPGLGTLANHIVIAMFADRPEAIPGVMTVPWDAEGGRPAGVPAYVLQHVGKERQRITSVAVGPDGLYVVPALPLPNGVSAILKLRHDPGHEHSVIIGRAGSDAKGLELAQEKGCLSCHRIKGNGEGGIGPPLDDSFIEFILMPSINAETYEQRVAAVDRLDEEPFVSYRDERHDVLAAEGRERTRRWIKYRLLEPRFDDPEAVMPNLGLTEAEATALRDYLVPEEGEQTSILDRVRDMDKAQLTMAAFVLGAVSSALAIGLLGVAVRARRKRSATRQRALS